MNKMIGKFVFRVALALVALQIAAPASNAQSSACPVAAPPASTGGCRLTLTTGTNCQTLSSSLTGYFEFAWATGGTFCEGPVKVLIAGSPADTWLYGNNYVLYTVSSGTGSGYWSWMDRRIGGYVHLTPADLAGVTSDNGQYYWGVQSYYGSSSGLGTFTMQGYSASDSTAPSVPAGLGATAAGATQVNLSWTASTDSVGVTAYKVYRGGSLVATLGNVTSYSDAGLTASTRYSYTVAACDAAGNCSAQSAAASATTQQAGATSANQKSDCLFNWGESNYPGYFAPRGAPSQSYAAYYYRYYSQTSAYLGVSSGDGHLYYLGPQSGNTLMDLGAVSQWYMTAGCG